MSEYLPGIIWLVVLLAVNAFFVLSGYLIAESRVRTTLVPYLWRRFLRIYPAFLVSLLVVAAVFAPLAAALEGTSLDVAAAAAALGITTWHLSISHDAGIASAMALAQR